MIRVETPSGTYEVEFSHPTVKTILPGPGKITLLQRETNADIYQIVPSRLPIFKPERRLLATGKAKCHLADRFNKSVGRKISLERALCNSLLGKADRRLFWAAYHSRAIQPPVIPIQRAVALSTTVH